MIDSVWDRIRQAVINHLKIYILKHFVSDVLRQFDTRLSIVLSKYTRSLPPYIANREKDDLQVIGQIEFLETIKVWDPEQNTIIWPLAQKRILGAMKDHIRYISRRDPARIYDYISDAADLLSGMQESNRFETDIENGDQLNRAMKVLSMKEKKIVVAHVHKDLTFKEISKKIDISESQISRIYNKALEKLKKELLKH